MNSEKIKKLSTESKQFRVIQQANFMIRNYIRMDMLRMAVLLVLIILAYNMLEGFAYFLFCVFIILVNGIVFSDVMDNALDVQREKMLEIMEE